MRFGTAEVTGTTLASAWAICRVLDREANGGRPADVSRAAALADDSPRCPYGPRGEVCRYSGTDRQHTTHSYIWQRYAAGGTRQDQLVTW